MNPYLDHPLTIACISFLMGVIITALRYREKAIRDGRVRYYACKDCGREHALDPHGKWMALRTVEEIQAQEERIKAAQKRFANVPPVTQLDPVPLCTHDVPLDRYCSKCAEVMAPKEAQDPRRG